jgi:hypothetical protein
MDQSSNKNMKNALSRAVKQRAKTGSTPYVVKNFCKVIPQLGILVHLLEEISNKWNRKIHRAVLKV